MRLINCYIDHGQCWTVLNWFFMILFSHMTFKHVCVFFLHILFTLICLHVILFIWFIYFPVIIHLFPMFRCDILTLVFLLTQLMTYYSHNATMSSTCALSGQNKLPAIITCSSYFIAILRGASDCSAGTETSSWAESAPCCSHDVFGVIFEPFLDSAEAVSVYTHLTPAVMTGTRWEEINEGGKRNQKRSQVQPSDKIQASFFTLEELPWVAVRCLGACLIVPNAQMWKKKEE